MTRLRNVTRALLLLLSVAIATPSFAQVLADGRIVVTVTDQTGAVLPTARVMVVSIEDATKASMPAPAIASDRGVATVSNLLPGRYSIRVEFDGFEPAVIADFRVRSGENRRAVTLALSKMNQQETVKRDAQVAATDPRGLTFGSTLTREQIEALSDDPTELERQLREMAGGDAIIRVDSFEGSQLPPKSQIKAIHISRDQFSAENHFAEGIHIDIVTQAGIGPLRGGVNYGLRDSALDGRNPLTPKKGPARNQNYGVSTGGTLIPNVLSASMNIGQSRSFSTPNLYATSTGGALISEAANLRTPSNGLNFYGDLSYALTKDQTMRVYYSANQNKTSNQGVGSYDLLDRAFSSEQTSHNIRGQEAGPLGRRFVTNTKFMIGWSQSKSSSVTDAPTIRVLDAFTTGGAQRKGGRTTKDFMVQSDLDYVRGIHTWRTGVLLNGGSYRSDDASNYLGTYTFESLTAFEQNRPRSYTRRIGDPLVEYTNLQAGWYIQDDLRVRKNLSFSPGIRYEVQTHLRQKSAISPRFGFTYSPFKSGRTSLRASWGIFHDWLAANTYEQTLRVDGFRQQELNILNPSYPNPALSTGLVNATNRYLLDSNLKMPRTMRLSASFDQTVSRLRLSGTYAYTRGENALRGENLNAPVNGVRPMPEFSNVIRVLSDGSNRQHQFNTSGNFSFSAPSAALTRERFNIRRGSVNFNYSMSHRKNNTDGAFSTPATGSLDAEWGFAPGDVRHRVGMSLNSQMLKNMNINMGFNRSSAPAYNITTGVDTNGDLIFNDRPAGTPRNSERALPSWSINANFNYTLGIGKKAGAGNTGITGPMMVGRETMIMVAGGGMPMMMNGGMPGGQPEAPPKYRVGFNLSIQNLTNHANYGGFSGVMTSQFFRTYTSVQGMRSVNFGINVSF
jgi:hypothetical protein